MDNIKSQLFENYVYRNAGTAEINAIWWYFVTAAYI